MMSLSAVDQAYEQLAGELSTGRYAPGARLPGERQLAIDLSVSRATLRLALGRLAAEGALRRSAQRGWFVPRNLIGLAILRHGTRFLRRVSVGAARGWRVGLAGVRG